MESNFYPKINPQNEVFQISVLKVRMLQRNRKFFP